MSDTFFPTIGSVADKADGLPQNTQPGNDQTGVSAEDTDRPLEEIESLCMKCGEQARFIATEYGMSII